MSRVRRIYAIRKATPSVLASSLFAVAALWAIGREVWVAQVFANMPSIFDIPAVTSFMTYAFFHTDLPVQILCVALAVAAVGFVKSCVRILTPFTHAYA